MQSDPIVSCIMPTANRPGYAADAIALFRAQRYPRTELVIVEDGLHQLKLNEPGVVYHRMPGKNTIGAKRNVACSLASGEIICHWDDDDLSHADRVAHQVETLLETGAQVVGFHAMLFVDRATGRMRRWRYFDLFRALGTSLMYWRDYWSSGRRFSEIATSGEDHLFIERAMREGVIYCEDAERLLIGTNHNSHTSPRDYTAANWEEVEEVAA